MSCLDFTYSTPLIFLLNITPETRIALWPLNQIPSRTARNSRLTIPDHPYFENLILPHFGDMSVQPDLIPEHLKVALSQKLILGVPNSKFDFD